MKKYLFFNILNDIDFGFERCFTISKFVLLFLIFQTSLVFAQHDKSPNTVVTIQKNNASLREILNEIENQTGLFFVYSKEDVQEKTVVNINVVNERLTKILGDFLSPLGLTYEFSGYNVVLRSVSTKIEPEVQIIKAIAPNKIQITGLVLDYYGVPIVGAWIVEEGSDFNNSTYTDSRGEFSLNVSPTGTFIVKYIGYRKQSIAVYGKKRFTVRLFEDIAKLQEIVVIGYGTQKKINLTGSLATIPSEMIVQAHRPNMSNALGGTSAGLRSIQMSGRPGEDDSNLDIRGYGNPLVIVDGVERSYAQIDPNEVESVTVLKDASAAVYGFKGANGVLLITTKKGFQGKTKINYNFNYGQQSTASHVEMMNAMEYMTYINEANLNIGGARLYSDEDIQKVAKGTHSYLSNTDWYKELIRENAPLVQHNVNVSGGNEVTKYFLSVGYLNQDGLIKTKDELKRYNFRSNISTIIEKNLTAEMQIGSHSELRDSPVEVSGEWNDTDDRFSLGIFKALAISLPIYSVYSKNNPDYYSAVQPSVRNPVASVDRNLVGTSSQKTEAFNGQFALKYDMPFLKGMTAKAQVAYDKTIGTSKNIKKIWNVYDDVIDQLVNWQSINTVVVYNKQENYSTQQYSLNYENSFGKHDFSGLMLWEIKNYDMTWTKSSAEFDVINVPEFDAANAKNQKVSGTSENKAWAGLVGRFNYAYNSRYLAELSFRFDGSYKFAPEYRWALFPAISMGWRLSDESFIKDYTSIFDNLKLRASYGIIGDESDSKPGNFLEGFDYPGDKYVLGSDHVIIGIKDKGLTNKQFTWYESRISDIGLDGTLWGNLLSFEFDWFYRKRTGLKATLQNTVPSSVGTIFPEQNLNSDDNRGVEIVLGSTRKIGEVLLNVKGTFSYSRRKILFQEKAEYGNAYLNWRENTNGRWDNITWGYQAIGQFQSYEELLSAPIQDENGNLSLMPGDLKYKDTNNDGLINNLDFQPIGRGATPELFYGLNLDLTWKGFDLLVFFQGAANFSYTVYFRSPFEQNGNGYKMFEDRWHRANPDDLSSEWIPGRFPAIRTTNPNIESSTFWNKNISYIRLKNIELGYTLPMTLYKKIGLQKLRFYVSAFNWLTFTNKPLEGMNPEGSAFLGQSYPQMKALNFGLNIEF